MGYDIVTTWSPRVGPTGDDKYNLPDESDVDKGVSVFSSPPTVAELNAASGINQIIAAYNRRAHFQNTCFGHSLRIFPYLKSVDGLQSQTCTFVLVGLILTVTTSTDHGYSPGHVVFLNLSGDNVRTNAYMIDTVPSLNTFTVRTGVGVGYTAVAGQNYCAPINNLPHTLLIEIRNAITALRNNEGLSIYTFISELEIRQGLPIKATHVADIRKSMRLSGVFKPKLTAVYFHGESDTGYPVWLAAFTYALGITQIGKVAKDTISRRRGRRLMSFAITEWYDGSGAPILTISTGARIVNLEAIDALDLYSSNTSDIPYDLTAVPPLGPMSHVDVLQGSLLAPAPFSGYVFNVSAADVLSFACAHISLILGTRQEINGTGAWNPINTNASAIEAASGPFMDIDLGA